MTATPPEANEGPKEPPVRQPSIQPFAGRIGGNQALVADPNDSSNRSLLEKVPDAGPYMRLSQILDLRGFTDLNLWKFALIECAGTMMLCFITAWIGLSGASSSSATTTSAAGVFATTAFLDPLVGGITNWIWLSLFIFIFGPISGGHLNPTITMATFFARLISLPRTVLYILAQTVGGTLAGLILHAAYGNGDFTVGGCIVEVALVQPRQAFLLEFMCSLILLFVAFGVALNPRQEHVYGPGQAPWMVGLTLGTLSFGSAFSLTGYAGASMNPARCFGVYIATGFPGYHWLHWVGPFAAAVGHAIMYHLLPPWIAE
ncbi:hypothetical protein ASPZODRAFT_17338 [Penicilliopsis zonata CBS 506.65]|uniref:Aquaporin n=1 Tax=Penicilliopsis zonata CBS 506.65 TaxID=1073090 RepID=A0A1L9SFN1_9EURO|nr:hypothetical protein ASPZODRAFT_17338 [Penicilliopsis zonata CBS 506.65]OJJ45907.1 hypothetical protein ASPZODRAFT_17338 [Penicilliopsis zonata CBS 506.65]